MNLEKIGKYILKKRTKKDLTQEQLAKELNTTRTTVSKWERGLIAPDITLLANLSETLGVSVIELLQGEDLKKEEKIEKNQSETINIVKYYNNNTKKKYLTIISIILLILVFIISLFLILDSTKFTSSELNIEENDFQIKGYIFDSKIKDILIIKNILQNNKYIGTDKETIVSKMKIKLISGEETLISKEYAYDNMAISDALNSISITIDNKNNINFNNLIIQLEITDIENESKTYIIDISQ